MTESQDAEPNVPDPRDVAPTEPAARRAARDAMIIEALVGGLSYGEAAGLAGCSDKTVRRLMKDPAHRAEVARRRDLRNLENVGLLINYESRAIRKLGEILETGTPAEVLAAARLILTVGPRLRAIADVEARLSEQDRLLDDLDDHRQQADGNDPELERDGDDD